jgi:hypothetical protein
VTSAVNDVLRGAKKMRLTPHESARWVKIAGFEPADVRSEDVRHEAPPGTTSRERAYLSSETHHVVLPRCATFARLMSALPSVSMQDAG